MNIIMLLIFSRIVWVSPVLVPTTGGQVGTYQSASTQIFHAHSYLTGHEFYRWVEGDIITAVYEDGSTRRFIVSDKDAYAFGRPGKPYDLRVDKEWVNYWDVVERYSTPNGLTFITCYADSEGYGQVTGRLFVEFSPLEADYVYTWMHNPGAGRPASAQ